MDFSYLYSALISLSAWSVSNMEVCYNLPVPLWFVNFSLSKIGIHRLNWRWYENMLMCMHPWTVFTIKTKQFIHNGLLTPSIYCAVYKPTRKKDFCLKYTVHLETHLSRRQIQKLMNITFCIPLLQRHLFILVIYLFLFLKSLT